MGWSFIAPKAADLRSLPVAAAAAGAALTPVAAQALEMPEAVPMILGYILSRVFKILENNGIVIKIIILI